MSIDKHGEAFAADRGEIDGGADAFVEGGAVGQIGERVVMRHVGDALLAALALGEVVDHDDDVLRLTVGGRDRQSRSRW